MEREARRDTRCEILDAAEDLLQSLSFNCFSYQDISERLGIRKASLYYHFPSKSDLGVALVERFRQRFRQWCRGMGRPPRSPADRLEAYLTSYESQLNASKICAGGALAAEFNAISPDMQEALRRLMADHHDWLTELLAEGRETGSFGYPGSPQAQAALVSAAIQGALQQARACGHETFRNAMQQLRRTVAPG